MTTGATVSPPWVGPSGAPTPEGCHYRPAPEQLVPVGPAGLGRAGRGGASTVGGEWRVSVSGESRGRGGWDGASSAIWREGRLTAANMLSVELIW